MSTPLRVLRLPLLAGLLSGIAFACGSSDEPSGTPGHSGSGAGSLGAGKSGHSNAGRSGAGTGGRQGGAGGEAGVTGDTGGRAMGGNGGRVVGSAGDAPGAAGEPGGAPGVGGSNGGRAAAGMGGEAGGPSECAIGALACPCTLGGGCDPGLTCELGHCTDCPTGQEGCACGEGDSCDGILLCAVSNLCTGPQVLRNDSWEPTGTLNYQAGFETGDQAAAVLGPATVASTLKEVRLVFGGAAGTSTITLSVYSDDGDVSPGTPLYAGDFEITAADDVFNVLDVSAENIAVPEGASLRVAITLDHSGDPSVATDDDGIETDRNYVHLLGTGWVHAEYLDIIDDFVIRAELTPI